jgi:Cyclin, C-terminal domain
MKAYYFARYLIETVLLEYTMLKYNNSLIAAGGIFLVNKIFKKHGWTDTLSHHTGYSEAEVKPCAKDLYFTM